VIATHDPLMLEVADRVVELRDGRIVQSAEPARA
jgi:ABC-type lipoprotein export system ATPase subunit